MNFLSEHSSAQLFLNFPLLKKVKYSVVIPVKNEELNILETLNAFLLQETLNGDFFDFKKFEILILANNCSDHSVSIIDDFTKKNPKLTIYMEEVTLLPDQANIGFVRKILMDAAFRRLQKNGGGIILTTDGDTSVAKDWIAQNIFEIESGADAVGGRILLKPKELAELDHAAKTLHFKDEKYQLLVADFEAKILNEPHDPAPKHHQHFNGSFAVTTECYEKSGGIPNVTYLEDCAFFEQLQFIDAKVRHSFKVVVHTSARCIGRTEVGLSYQLNEWKMIGKNGAKVYVESSEAVLERLLLKKNLLHLWERREISKLTIQSEFNKMFPEMSLKNDAHLSIFNYSYFGAWYAEILKIVKDEWTKKDTLIFIDKAVNDLETLLQNYEITNFSQTSIR